MQTRRPPSACETASFCQREASLWMRDGFFLQTRELPSACARASFCMREGSFVQTRGFLLHTRRFVCACERAYLCMREAFFLYARRLLCASETLLCACCRLAHASVVEGNWARFSGRRESVSSFSPSRSSRLRVKPVPFHANVKSLCCLLNVLANQRRKIDPHLRGDRGAVRDQSVLQRHRTGAVARACGGPRDG